MMNKPTASLYTVIHPLLGRRLVTVSVELKEDRGIKLARARWSNALVDSDGITMVVQMLPQLVDWSGVGTPNHPSMAPPPLPFVAPGKEAVASAQSPGRQLNLILNVVMAIESLPI